MFDYSPINTYPCTPPGVATNIKKKVVVQINGAVSGVNRMKVLECCPVSGKTVCLQRVSNSACPPGTERRFSHDF